MKKEWLNSHWLSLRPLRINSTEISRKLSNDLGKSDEKLWIFLIPRIKIILPNHQSHITQLKVYLIMVGERHKQVFNQNQTHKLCQSQILAEASPQKANYYFCYSELQISVSSLELLLRKKKSTLFICTFFMFFKFVLLKPILRITGYVSSSFILCKPLII